MSSLAQSWTARSAAVASLTAAATEWTQIARPWIGQTGEPARRPKGAGRLSASGPSDRAISTLHEADTPMARTARQSLYALGILLALSAGAHAMDTTAAGNRGADQPATISQQTAKAQLVEASRTFRGVGFVTAIEPNGSLTINHQPIEGLMPAMEMVFPVNPRTLAQGVRPGDEVEFNIEGKTYVITHLKVVGHAQ